MIYFESNADQVVGEEDVDDVDAVLAAAAVVVVVDAAAEQQPTHLSEGLEN